MNDPFKDDQQKDNQLQDNLRKEENELKPSYFSYGPYRSTNQENSSTDIPAQGQEATPLPDQQEDTPSSMKRNAQENQLIDVVKPPIPNKYSARFGLVASFLAGAIVVAGLMFVADKSDLFSGGVQANNTADQSTPVNGQNVTANESQSTTRSVVNTAFNAVRPNNIAEIFKNASPAVVKVEAYSKSSGSRGNSMLFDDPFFRQFFGDDGSDNNADSGTLQQIGMGTGFIFDKSGYILTNEHVIEGAEEIRITVEGYDKPFIAKLLGNSYDLDLAALKIEGDKEFPVLPLGKADNLNIGDWVVAIGNPYGFEHTVTVGVLSAKERPISIQDGNGTRNYKHLLQTDASINPGNSGGPLLNLNGEVIGINTAVSTQAQGIGFAIPTTTISAVLDNLKNNVTIPKEPAPYIGVSLQDVDKSWLNDLKLENTDGALVNGVERKSPAFKAGLRPYDVILDVNQTKIKSSTELVAKIKSYKVGDKVVIGLIRDGKRIEVSVEVGDRNNTSK